MMPQGAPSPGGPQGPQDSSYQGGANPNQAPSGSNSPEEDGEKSPYSIFGDLQKALFQANQAIQGTKFPQIAQVHLKNALGEYNKFISVVGKTMGISMPDQDQMSMGMQDSTVQGSGSAVPAGQPMAGPGVRPVPV